MRPTAIAATASPSSFLAAGMNGRMIAGEDESWYADFAVDRPAL